MGDIVSVDPGALASSAQGLSDEVGALGSSASILAQAVQEAGQFGGNNPNDGVAVEFNEVYPSTITGIMQQYQEIMSLVQGISDNIGTSSDLVNQLSTVNNDTIDAAAALGHTAGPLA
jgi:peptidoglycan hydrolase-like protein with peptidoglycan-binding domain